MVAGIVNVLVAAVGLVGIIGGVTIMTGAYNVAATEPHYPITVSLFAAARDRAIAVRAKGITPPADWPERIDLNKGFRSYHEMCVVCHAAPGLNDSVVRKGLNPEPPKLTEDRVQQRSDTELFWIIKYGIKMSGMPAFGPTHTEEEIWEVTAFLRQLDEMQPPDYKDLMEQSELSSLIDASSHDHPSKGSH
ncbi:MAG: cytochrome c [Nitrospira sp.]|nr:cytochrome c [Nitrospira sp.]